MSTAVADKVIIVTGAGGRLGRRMVQRFTDDGAIVAALDLPPPGAEPPPFPGDAQGRVFQANVTVEDEVRTVFEQIQDELGPLYALIHTVGGWDGAPLTQTDLSDWSRLVDVNLTSAFLCFREAARLMQGREGRLIGICSAQGADHGRAQQAAYSASKAGVMRLVEAAAEEYRGTGLTAHAVAPSTLLFDGDADQDGVPAAHVVDLCAYLCTPVGASLTGDTLRAYGA